MKSENLKVSCPTCQKSVKWNERSEYRPFCCERCQQIDLGAWASDAYSIPSEPTEQDADLAQDPSGAPLPSSPYTLQ